MNDTQRVRFMVRPSFSKTELTYEWAGSETISVGDRVSIPAPWWLPNDGTPHYGTVTRIGSNYGGACIPLRRKLADA